MQPFETTWKVRFSDVDPAGVAFYPTVVRALHDGLEDFVEQFVGVPYDRVLTVDRLGWPAVDLHVSFRAPLRFGEVATLSMTILEIGRSSVKFRYVVRGADGGERAEAEVTVVTVALDGFRPVPIPERYRREFEKVLESAGPEDGP